jgi:hypothetical protein
MVYNFLLVDVDDVMREAILAGVIDGVRRDTAPGHDCAACSHRFPLGTRKLFRNYESEPQRAGRKYPRGYGGSGGRDPDYPRDGAAEPFCLADLASVLCD